MHKRRRLRVYVSEFEYVALTTVAEQHGQTVTDLLREAVNELVTDFRDGAAILKPRRQSEPRPRVTDS